MDGNEKGVNLESETTNTEENASKTTSFKLQDSLSSKFVESTPDDTNKLDLEDCFVEIPSQFVGSISSQPQGCFSITSESIIHDKFKFDYLVSRPFLRTSASASSAVWSRQQLNDGLKIVLAYRRTDLIKNNDVLDAAPQHDGVKTSTDRSSTSDDLLRSGSGQDNVVRGYCPAFFYKTDTASLESTSDEGLDGKLCRICYMSDKQERFIEPPACTCSGTMQYCHQSCLSNWVAQSGTKKCELCGYRFKIRALNMFRVTNWKCIPMTTLDKLYICLFLLASGFILTTGIYVCWAMLSPSVAATVERESTAAQILFPVYTGFDLFCLSVIMYVLKGRINQMWRKWRAYNRSIFILSRPTEEEV